MLSADFTELMTIQFLITVMPFGGLEQAFRGVTPSFHLSNNQFYETCSEAPFNLLISFGSTPDLFSQERVAPPLVSSAKKLMPQAQAYSRLGYRKNAVLPTPDAPIIRK